MRKLKYYQPVRFSAAVIKRAYEVFILQLDRSESQGSFRDLTIRKAGEAWQYDSMEEWLAEYPGAYGFRFSFGSMSYGLTVTGDEPDEASVIVELPSRGRIEAIFQVFEDAVPSSHVSEPNDLTVFIGHGHDNQWRDLKDHLTDQHQISVVAYEVGPRAGKSVKEVLEEMLDESSLAILVLTGEDIHADGEPHARENVTHELGLFQGRLGFTRAIALLEDGVKEFSNILGVNQIRFGRGRIREAFGDVVALIRREFP